MKEVLIFGNECQETKEIVQHLIQKHFKITIFTFAKFKDLTAFLGMSPLQVNVVVIKIANYYNWKHELNKFDVIINTIKISELPKENNVVVFENFTLAFGKCVKNLGKTVIYLSNVNNEYCYGEAVLNAEKAMLAQCETICYIKHGFIVHSQSELLTNLINSKFIFLSSNVLNAPLQITMMADLSSTIGQIAATGVQKNITISGESYSLKDIISLLNINNKNAKFVIEIPHFALMIIAKMFTIFPSRFYSSLYKYTTLKEILHISQNKFKAENTSSYTLFAKVLDKHLKNLFSPEIE